MLKLNDKLPLELRVLPWKRSHPPPILPIALPFRIFVFIMTRSLRKYMVFWYLIFTVILHQRHLAFFSFSSTPGLRSMAPVKAFFRLLVEYLLHLKLAWLISHIHGRSNITSWGQITTIHFNARTPKTKVFLHLIVYFQPFSEPYLRIFQFHPEVHGISFSTVKSPTLQKKLSIKPSQRKPQIAQWTIAFYIIADAPDVAVLFLEILSSIWADIQ